MIPRRVTPKMVFNLIGIFEDLSLPRTHLDMALAWMQWREINTWALVFRTENSEIWWYQDGLWLVFATPGEYRATNTHSWTVAFIKTKQVKKNSKAGIGEFASRNRSFTQKTWVNICINGKSVSTGNLFQQGNMFWQENLLQLENLIWRQDHAVSASISGGDLSFPSPYRNS